MYSIHRNNAMYINNRDKLGISKRTLYFADMAQMLSTTPLRSLLAYVHKSATHGFDKDLLVGKLVTEISKYGKNAQLSDSKMLQPVTVLVKKCCKDSPYVTSQTAVLHRSILDAENANFLSRSIDIASHTRLANSNTKSISNAPMETNPNRCISNSSQRFLNYSIDNASKAILTDSKSIASKEASCLNSFKSTSNSVSLNKSIDNASKAILTDSKSIASKAILTDSKSNASKAFLNKTISYASKAFLNKTISNASEEASLNKSISDASHAISLNKAIKSASDESSLNQCISNASNSIRTASLAASPNMPTIKVLHTNASDRVSTSKASKRKEKRLCPRHSKKTTTSSTEAQKHQGSRPEAVIKLDSIKVAQKSEQSTLLAKMNSVVNQTFVRTPQQISPLQTTQGDKPLQERLHDKFEAPFAKFMSNL
jgi:hypothetical protein